MNCWFFHFFSWLLTIAVSVTRHFVLVQKTQLEIVSRNICNICCLVYLHRLKYHESEKIIADNFKIDWLAIHIPSSLDSMKIHIPNNAIRPVYVRTPHCCKISLFWFMIFYARHAIQSVQDTLILYFRLILPANWKICLYCFAKFYF